MDNDDLLEELVPGLNLLFSQNDGDDRVDFRILAAIKEIAPARNLSIDDLQIVFHKALQELKHTTYNRDYPEYISFGYPVNEFTLIDDLKREFLRAHNSESIVSIFLESKQVHEVLNRINVYRIFHSGSEPILSREEFNHSAYLFMSFIANHENKEGILKNGSLVKKFPDYTLYGKISSIYPPPQITSSDNYEHINSLQKARQAFYPFAIKTLERLGDKNFFKNPEEQKELFKKHCTKSPCHEHYECLLEEDIALINCQSISQIYAEGVLEEGTLTALLYILGLYLFEAGFGLYSDLRYLLSPLIEIDEHDLPYFKAASYFALNPEEMILFDDASLKYQSLKEQQERFFLKYDEFLDECFPTIKLLRESQARLSEQAREEHKLEERKRNRIAHQSTCLSKTPPLVPITLIISNKINYLLKHGAQEELISLTETEMKILWILAVKKNNKVSLYEFEEELWPENKKIDTAINLRRHICNIREKLRKILSNLYTKPEYVDEFLPKAKNGSYRLVEKRIKVDIQQ